jgi:DnaJ family protein A protein 5
MEDSITEDDGDVALTQQLNELSLDEEEKTPDEEEKKPKKVYKKKKRRANKEDRKERAQGAPSLACGVCGEAFPSRTRLFAHIREFPEHAVLKGANGGHKT